jgi:hypothetical protein
MSLASTFWFDQIIYLTVHVYIFTSEVHGARLKSSADMIRQAAALLLLLSSALAQSQPKTTSGYSPFPFINRAHQDFWPHSEAKEHDSLLFDQKQDHFDPENTNTWPQVISISTH